MVACQQGGGFFLPLPEALEDDGFGRFVTACRLSRHMAGLLDILGLRLLEEKALQDGQDGFAALRQLPEPLPEITSGNSPQGRFLQEKLVLLLQPHLYALHIPLVQHGGYHHHGHWGLGNGHGGNDELCLQPLEIFFIYIQRRSLVHQPDIGVLLADAAGQQPGGAHACGAGHHRPVHHMSEVLAIREGRPQMHGNIGHLCLWQGAPQSFLHLGHRPAAHRHELRIMGLHFRQQWIADIHAHLHAAQGRAQVVYQSGQKTLIPPYIPAGLLTGPLHDALGQLHQMVIVHHRHRAKSLFPVAVPGPQQMHGNVANLILRHLYVEGLCHGLAQG